MKPSTIAPRSRPPLPAIRIGKSEKSDAETRFGRILVWFMRLLSLLWLAQGMLHWASLLLGDDNGPGVLTRMTDLGASAVIFFAVLDLVAAVGLWLSASWGGVVWIVAVAAQWLAVVVLPGFFTFDLALALADLVLVGIYFTITYRAARELDE